MSSSTETGHAKNVANFQDLITRVEKLGTAYNPSKEELQLLSLKTQHSTIAACMQRLAAALPHYQQAVDAREAAFAPLEKLVTRALNMFKASVDSPAEVNSAISLAKKIRGRSLPKRAAVEGVEAPRTISISQQSYALIISNFQMFIEVLAAHPAYKPNETELQIVGLNTLLADLQSKSQAVTQAQADVDADRSDRNALLYNTVTGLVKRGTAVKTYVKAAFTPDVAHYKPILSLEFRRP